MDAACRAILFIAGGVLPIVYLAWLAVRHVAPKTAAEQPEESLFTEIVESSGVQG